MIPTQAQPWSVTRPPEIASCWYRSNNLRLEPPGHKLMQTSEVPHTRIWQTCSHDHGPITTGRSGCYARTNRSHAINHQNCEVHRNIRSRTPSPCRRAWLYTFASPHPQGWRWPWKVDQNAWKRNAFCLPTGTGHASLAWVPCLRRNPPVAVVEMSEIYIGRRHLNSVKQKHSLDTRTRHYAHATHTRHTQARDERRATPAPTPAPPELENRWPLATSFHDTCQKRRGSTGFVAGRTQANGTAASPALSLPAPSVLHKNLSTTTSTESQSFLPYLSGLRCS